MTNRAKALIGFVLMVGFLGWTGLYFFTQPETVQVNIARGDIPPALSGMRIVQISDYHDGSWLWDEEKLLKSISAYEPDLVLLTGDMVDGYQRKWTSFLDIAHKLTLIAPVYAVPGNHEHYLSAARWEDLHRQIADAGIVLLENQAVILEHNGTKFCLAGVDDVAHIVKKARDANPAGVSSSFGLDAMRGYLNQIENWDDYDGMFKILLSHQPYYLAAYAEKDVHVMLSGHLHGGVIRVAGRGLAHLRKNINFPDADAGLYEKLGMSVYISRGVSHSYFEPRINNPPEITLIDLVR
ncbi:MAG: metallophosphoesterase, partial [Eubacteriales bacterium]|nr:metallophosphoesterase [Eubacteriales bacterium]